MIRVGSYYASLFQICAGLFLAATFFFEVDQIELWKVGLIMVLLAPLKIQPQEPAQ